MSARAALRLAGAALGLLAAPARAQVPADLTTERAEFARWLATDPLSPFAAVAVVPVGQGISLGAEPSDIPLPGIGRGRITESGGQVLLTLDGSSRALPRLRVTPLGPFRLFVSGAAGRAVVAAFGAIRRAHPTAWYDYRAGLRYAVALEPPEQRGRLRLLGLDGAETEAVEAGFVTVPLASGAHRLRVYRVGAAEDDEAPLQIFFRDSTSGHGSYPAGRFVDLLPEPGGTFTVDFNRARNPYCAYNTVFPCPVPWPGNRIAGMIEAGERYPAAPSP